MVDIVENLLRSLYAYAKRVVSSPGKNHIQREPGRHLPGASVRLNAAYFAALFVCLTFGLLSMPAPASGAIHNVIQDCGATGDGIHDDTAAINSCIAALLPGDTLLFPCGTYKVTSLLKIGISNVTVDGSGCATVRWGAISSGDIFVFFGGPGSPCAENFNTRTGSCELGAPVALSATANELSRSFATVTSLGVNPGDFVYVEQGGKDYSTDISPGSDQGCDSSGCRGEVLQVQSVIGNTIMVTTALHDTYDPLLNGATAQKVLNPLTGITIQNITVDSASFATGPIVLWGVVNSTVSGVTSKNSANWSLYANVSYGLNFVNVSLNSIAGSQMFALGVYQHGSLVINGMSATGGGVFFSTGANDTISNFTVDASVALGRPFKTTSTRWSTFNSVTVKNGTGNLNGISVEYYSSHNAFNSCVVTNNSANGGTGTGNAGINLFGNYNRFNVFTNCTVTGNGNVQFYDNYFDKLRLGADSNNEIRGGTYSSAGSNTQEGVIFLEAPQASVWGATISGPTGTGYSGIEMHGPNGLGAPGASNACINNNVFIANTGLNGGISAAFASDIGAGNQLNGLSSNLTPGTCGNNFGHAVQGANVGTTMSNTITASRYQMPAQSGTITSMSVFVASPVSASPNNQFQVAIYADNNGTPGALIASSASQTIVPDAWNTVLINAPVTANAFYWLAYNTNGLAANTNNLRYDAGGGMTSWISPESFGTWPANFAPIGGTSTDSLSIYATFQ